MPRWIVIAAVAALPIVALAATPAQEKAFVDGYKAAYEGSNAKALHALLYTKGADPQALEFYRMMMTEGMGGKVSSIALEPLTADDKEEARSHDAGARRQVVPPDAGAGEEARDQARIVGEERQLGVDEHGVRRRGRRQAGDPGAGAAK